MSEMDSAWQAAAPAFGEMQGKLFTYRRGSDSVSIRACVVSHAIETETADNITQSWHGHVFTLEAASLLLAGEQVKPTRGDQIIETLDAGKVNVFTVMPTPQGRTYDPIDPEEFQYDVYTKLTSESVDA